MNTEMQQVLAPYYDADRDAYNIQAIQAAFDDDPDDYGWLFADTDEANPGDDAPLSAETQAAMAYNEAAWEREHAKTADEVYTAVTEGPKGEWWVALAMMGSSDDEKRKLARMFTATIDRCVEKGLDSDPAVNALYMECLLALPHIVINGEAVASTVDDEDGLPIGTTIRDIDRVGKQQAELFSHESETYLASLGL